MELVGQLRGLGAARVNHDHPATALFQGLEPSSKVRNGHQATIGCHGIGANADKQIRVIDIGNGKQNLVSEHFQAGQHVR